MKPLAFVVAGAALMLSGCIVSDTASRSREAQPSSYAGSEEPFPVLNAYGNWIDVGIYGRVWQPAVLSDWRPYTLGRWVWTDRGWMWDSDEPFGWVVYHYGYWTQIGALGWVWVPGNDWSPARVDWYTDNGYVGWAPMAPPQASYPEAYQPGYENYWTVVPAPQFTRLNVGAYRVMQPQPATRSTGAARGRAVQRPPDIITIQGATHQLISPVRTEEERVRSGRRTVERVRLAEENRTAPSPVYGAPSRPDPVTQPPSPPVYLPGASRSLPTPAPAPSVPAPRPAVVNPAPTPARPPGGRITPAPEVVRVAPAPPPPRVVPPPARTDGKRVIVPEKPAQRKPEPKVEKKENK
ncbi:MAG TPA: DUF6600 domain-containing protein [Bacteroidota bacterium]|nr:DUF6600 domain-containing protein [Bacteroidota bacterium]